MQIQFSFDDNEIDADEPLGSLTISDGGETFLAETVWLDDFFQGLIQAYDSTLANGTASIELDSEPDRIHMESVGKGLRIEHAGAAIQISDFAEFGKGLRAACSDLLKSLPDRHENPTLLILKGFVGRDT